MMILLFLSLCSVSYAFQDIVDDGETVTNKLMYVIPDTVTYNLPVIGSGFTVSSDQGFSASNGITATTGNIVATAGQVNAGTTMTAGTGLVATTGGLTVSAGGAAITGTTTFNRALAVLP